MRCAALIVLAVAASAATLSAQGQVPAEFVPAFDVASIKPAPSQLEVAITPPSPDRFYRPTITLRSLLNYAYDMREFRIVGGPPWVSSERWEVSAKATTAVTPSVMRRLVRQLLADRFALRTHLDVRELPIYELVLARRDGRLGPGMKAAQVDCEPFRSGDGTPRDSPIDADTGFARCGVGFRIGGGVRTARYNGTPLRRLATFLSATVDRWIVDSTGLGGSYDIELTYQDEGRLLPGATLREAPALFTALEEQLGLKLEPSRGPVEVLVIDSVERPTPD